MYKKLTCALLMGLVAAGCQNAARPQQSKTKESGETKPGTQSESVSSETTQAKGEEQKTGSETAEVSTAPPVFNKPVPIQIEHDEAYIDPISSDINFVGSKKDGSHNGGFRRFKGKFKLDRPAELISSLELEIETSSIFTDDNRLTAHLKGPDFFNTKDHEKITFKSSKVEGGDGKFTITGELTILGKTNEIKIPIRTEFNDRGVRVLADFTIDRLAFGMEYQKETINKEVKISYVGGTPLQLVASAPAGGPGGPGGGGGRGGDAGGPRGIISFDPESIFNRRDEDKNGKLSGEEIPERMKNDAGEIEQGIDKDEDGSINLEEFEARFKEQQKRRGGGRSGGGGRNRGGGGAASTTKAVDP